MNRVQGKQVPVSQLPENPPPRRRYKTPQTLDYSFAIEKGEKKVRDIDPSHEISRTTRSISIIYLQ